MAPDGTIVQNGEVLETFPPCAHPPVLTGPATGYSATATAAGTPTAQASKIHAEWESNPAGTWWGWVENTAQDDTYGFDELLASIWVPPQPTGTNGGGQQLYYFDALYGAFSDLPICHGIMQPVLVWSPGGWTIEAEYDDPGYGIFGSGASSVNVGDQISISVYIATSFVSDGVTYYEYIAYAYDNDNGAFQYYPWYLPCTLVAGYPAVFEVGGAGIDSCADVPNNYVNFTNISQYDMNPSWDSYTPVGYSGAIDVQ